jgi:hypothetical protein
MEFTRLARVAAGLTFLWCLSAEAQNWSISGAAAAPERTATGPNKTTPFFDAVRGSGVWFVPGVKGRAVLYLPVTALDNTVLRSMSLRVAGVGSGYIKADLFEESAGVTPARLGALAVVDQTTSGAFVLATNLIERPVNNKKNTYSIRIEMCNDSASATFTSALNPAVYSVNLSPDRCNCPPPPPWPWQPISIRTCRVQ